MDGRDPEQSSVQQTGAEGRSGFIAEGVRKALLAGVGALFLTEEGARRLAREWKLPKDVLGYIGQQAQGAKGEILRVFAEEFRRFLESESVRREFWSVLSDSSIEIRAEIRVRRDAAGAAHPVVSASVRARPGKKASSAPARRGRGSRGT